MTEFIPVISAIAGALIAFLAMLVQYMITTSKERKILLRNRLEEIGTIAEEIVFWADQDLNSMHTIAAGGKLDDSIPRREYLQRLCTLSRVTKIYHSQLEQDAYKFIQIVKKYDEAKISFTVKMIENSSFDFQSYKEKVHQKFELLSQTENQFVEAVRKSMRKLL